MPKYYPRTSHSHYLGALFALIRVEANKSTDELERLLWVPCYPSIYGNNGRWSNMAGPERLATLRKIAPRMMARKGVGDIVEALLERNMDTTHLYDPAIQAITQKDALQPLDKIKELCAAVGLTYRPHRKRGGEHKIVDVFQTDMPPVDKPHIRRERRVEPGEHKESLFEKDDSICAVPPRTPLQALAQELFLQNRRNHKKWGEMHNWQRIEFIEAKAETLPKDNLRDLWEKTGRTLLGQAEPFIKGKHKKPADELDYTGLKRRLRHYADTKSEQVPKSPLLRRIYYWAKAAP